MQGASGCMREQCMRASITRSRAALPTRMLRRTAHAAAAAHAAPSNAACCYCCCNAPTFSALSGTSSATSRLLPTVSAVIATWQPRRTQQQQQGLVQACRGRSMLRARARAHTRSLLSRARLHAPARTAHAQQPARVRTVRRPHLPAPREGRARPQQHEVQARAQRIVGGRHAQPEVQKHAAVQQRSRGAAADERVDHDVALRLLGTHACMCARVWGCACAGMHDGGARASKGGRKNKWSARGCSAAQAAHKRTARKQAAGRTWPNRAAPNRPVAA